ncbi:MAG: O-antigen ligase family protein [Candidatus Uhrbacteria bacterium]
MITLLRHPRANVIIPAFIAGTLAIILPAGAFAIALAVVALLAIVAAWPFFGWSLVVLVYPFIYLQLFLGQTMNVPYVDLLAMATFIGVAIRTVAVRWQGSASVRFATIFRSLRGLTGLLPFLAFLAVAVLSLQNVEEVALGIKYLLRPLLFFYLMYVALPLLVVNSPRRLFVTFRLLFAVGIAVAAMGVWSLIFPPEPGAFRRAVPIVMFGMTPLGTNHNLIAEVLVSVIPIGFLLAAFSRERARRWYVVGTCALALVTLLTFSRNGWLTLSAEVAILLIAFARERGLTFKRIVLLALPLVALVALAVGVFSMTTVARSSNINRLRLTEIALAQFRAHPLVGGGVGTFMETVSRDRWYIADFGKPQEAHGLVQKLLAETGALGLITFLWLLVAVVHRLLDVYRRATVSPAWRLILLALLLSAAGSIIFQLFNTSYFVSKMWLPLGIALAAARLAEQGIALRTDGSIDARTS